MAVEITVKGDDMCLTRVATSGIVITGNRDGNHLEVQVDVPSPISREEAANLIGMFFVRLEEVFDEAFITQCAACYAAETGKEFLETGQGHKIVMLRGGDRGKKKRR